MKLKEARVRKYFSMAELAKKAKVSLATIRDTEGGKRLPSLTTCRKLAEALETNPDEIDEFREALEKALRE